MIQKSLSLLPAVGLCAGEGWAGVSGEASVVWHPHPAELCTVERVLLLFASKEKKKRITVGGFLCRSLIVQSALPWLSEGLCLVRTGFHAGSAEVPGLQRVGASCGLAGYQGFCAVCAELQGSSFFVFFFWVTPSPLPSFPHLWWGHMDHTWAEPFSIAPRGSTACLGE